MIINFLDILNKLYFKYPNGCICFTYRYICSHYNYPFCKFIQNSKIEKISNYNSYEIKSDICFILTKYNLDMLNKFLSNYSFELFYGDIAYYSKEKKLLFCAINFIDGIMEAEVLIDNIDILKS